MPKRVLLIALFLLISIAAILLFYSQKSNSAIVFVDSNKLFTDFSMTKELKKSGEKELKFKSRQLDSLQLLLNMAADENSKSALLQQLITQRQDIEAYQKNFADANSQKIWDRIEGYTKDFAKKNNYEMIIGSQYRGDVIYGEEKVNVTTQLLNFINKKYEGL